MSATAKYHPYALRIPQEDAKALAEAQSKSGQSVNQLIVQCVRRALPEVLAQFLPKNTPAPRARLVRKNGRTYLTNGRKFTSEDVAAALADFP